MTIGIRTSALWTNSFGVCGRFSVFSLALLFSAEEAEAVPAFAEQVGVPCSTCHVGGFGPQLTPFGRQFKLGGYTLRSGSDFTTPFAAMMIDSFVHSQKDQTTPPAPHYDVNDNATIDQISIFVAGGFGQHFGGFSQFTYDGVGRAFSWDNLDLRFVSNATVGGSNLLVGVSLNNSPGVQDVWNTLPAWGFPYTYSGVVPAPGAGTILSGSLAQRVLGVSAYAWWDASIYVEAGAYWNPGRGFLRSMGVDIFDGGTVLSGGAPYIRVAYQKTYDDQNFEIGASGLWSSTNPATDMPGTDHYTDLTLDASWQYIGTEDHIFQINGRYTHEWQNLSQSVLIGNAANKKQQSQRIASRCFLLLASQIRRNSELFRHLGLAR